MNKKGSTYDAIVIGSGISGGWAAKELCEKGLKTLLLERGQNVEHIKDYPTATLNPWELAPGEGEVFYVNNTVHPYIEEQPFMWVRGYQVGGDP